MLRFQKLIELDGWTNALLGNVLIAQFKSDERGTTVRWRHPRHPDVDDVEDFTSEPAAIATITLFAQYVLPAAAS